MKPNYMNKCILVIFAFLSLVVQAQRDDHDHPGSTVHVNNAAFDSIKSLVGDWKGTFKWTGRSSEGTMNARYYLTGNGTAVVEDLINEGNVVMTSVYHLDGPDLRVTHFCAAGNQPRLKAGPFDDQNKTVVFHFVDVTNLTSPGAPHVSGLELRFVDVAHITIIFTFTASGKESFEQVDLIRS
jgi:hypothetical protein